MEILEKTSQQHLPPMWISNDGSKKALPAFYCTWILTVERWQPTLNALQLYGNISYFCLFPLNFSLIFRDFICFALILSFAQIFLNIQNILLLISYLLFKLIRSILRIVIKVKVRDIVIVIVGTTINTVGIDFIQ